MALGTHRDRRAHQGLPWTEVPLRGQGHYFQQEPCAPSPRAGLSSAFTLQTCLRPPPFPLW